MIMHSNVVTKSDRSVGWYRRVIRNAELANDSDVPGCMVIRPWGYAIWENIQRILDRRFKETGHENAYFPLLIPQRSLQKEAKHLAGFARECVVVTHHKLERNDEHVLVPQVQLGDPLIIRPTSEIVAGKAFSKWLRSYRQLPILINQWANVMRWENNPLLFLRTSEFLWQEGHTAHATQEEAEEETKKMLDVYEEFAQEYLAIPVIKGEKTPEERFPGAVNTYTIEAMMQDLKALQMGTSHFLGQKFAEATGLRFRDAEGNMAFAWTTSWGVSTRLIGGIIMAHSDDEGLVLPPHIAPKQVVLLPLFKNHGEREKIMPYCQSIVSDLSRRAFGDDRVRVLLDVRDIGRRECFLDSIRRGIPVRLEIGPKEMATETITVGTRDKPSNERKTEPKNRVIDDICSTLSDIHSNLFHRAKEFQERNTKSISSVKEFEEYFSSSGQNGFALCHGDYGDRNEKWAARDKILKELKVSARCMPLEMQDEEGECIFTGRKVKTKVIYARTY